MMRTHSSENMQRLPLPLYRSGDARRAHTTKQGSRSTIGITLVALLLMTFGCASPQADIDLRQPDALMKSYFDGEWYFRQTLTHLSPESGVGFSGLEGSLEKIRWEITEDYLYALRSYEPIEGLDEEYTLEGGSERGDPVAAFRILSHFDIQRRYNAATGERGNVIEENQFDRPWYERERMRVDWSSNQVTGPSDLTFVWWRASALDSLRAYETDDPDQLVIDEDTLRVTVEGTISDGGFACAIAYGSWGCGSAQARVRFSFRRIIEGEDEGFQPLPYFDRLPLAKLREGESCPPGQEEICAARCPYEPYSDQWFQRCEKVRSFSYGFGEDGARVEFACNEDFIESFNRFVTCAVNDLDIFSCDEEGVEGEGIPLVPYLTTQDCEDEGVSAFGRFGYFRTERFDYDRQLGGAHDQRRRFYANHHQLWRDAAQEQPKPIIYYLSPEYPSSLEEVTARIGLDWDAAFIEAATLKSGRSEETLREALLADAEEAGVGAWRFLEADPLRASGLFQVRRNRCSLEGINAWRENFVGNE